MSFDNLPFDSREDAVKTIVDETGVDEKAAETLADTLEREGQDDEGDAKTLWQKIKSGAESVISDLGLEIVSWVETPAQDSMFVAMKSGKDGKEYHRVQTPILKQENEDFSTVFGPVMRPSDIDKEGDVVPAHVIKESAHEFLSEGRVDQFDSDHDMMTGEGTLVESWTLKEDTEFELPDGSMEKIEKGAWMVGVQPSDEIKERIQQGDITGFSIFGEAEKIELAGGKSIKRTGDNKENTGTGDNMGDSQNDGNDGNEEALKGLKETVESMKDELSSLGDKMDDLSPEEPEAKTIESVEDLIDTAKDAGDEPVTIELSIDEDSLEALKEDDEDDEEDEDDEDKSEANTSKGADEEDVRKGQTESKGSRNTPDYAGTIRGEYNE